MLSSNEWLSQELKKIFHTNWRDNLTCLSPYIRPLIFGFSTRVSGAGGRMFNAWWGLIWLYCLSQTLIATWACLEWQQQGLNPPQVVLDQVATYKTEMDSIAQFIEQECSLEADTKYSASKLYEAYRHHCQAIGRKPQSTNAFKKALDKITNVYQSRTSSGMQWHGIQPVMQF